MRDSKNFSVYSKKSMLNFWIEILTSFLIFYDVFNLFIIHKNKDKMFKTLFCWINSKFPQLECNSYQALYLVLCSDESILNRLILEYSLVEISLKSLQDLV